MIRIPRAELDYAIAAIRGCANAARDRQGLRVLFPLTDEDALRLILAGLATVAPGRLPQSVMPMDVVEMEVVRESAPTPLREVMEPVGETVGVEVGSESGERP